jgi:hypothetical protein
LVEGYTHCFEAEAEIGCSRARGFGHSMTRRGCARADEEGAFFVLATGLAAGRGGEGGGS